MTETPAKYAAAKAPATSSRPVWPCRGMWRVIRTAGIRWGGGLSIACSLLHVRPSLTDAELDWPLRTANCTGFPVVLGFSRPSRCRARIGSASRRRPTPSRGPSAKYSEPTDEEFQAMLDERLPLPAKVLKEYWVTAACLAPLGHARLPGGVFRSRPERRTSGAVEGHREYFSRSLNAPRYACDVARIKSACVDTNFSTQSELRSLAVPSSSLNTPSNIFSSASSQMRGHSLCSTRARARSSI